MFVECLDAHRVGVRWNFHDIGSGTGSPLKRLDTRRRILANETQRTKKPQGGERQHPFQPAIPFRLSEKCRDPSEFADFFNLIRLTARPGETSAGSEMGAQAG